LKKNPSRNLAILLISSLLSIYSFSKTENIIDKENFPPETEKIIKQELNKHPETFNTNYKKGYEFILSQEGWDFVRKEEGLRLDAYKLGDEMVTIGYGHANPISRSKFKPGDKITKSQANKLFIKDMNEAAKGVRRIFHQWEKQGIDIEINQDQYDVLVSLAYNMGVSTLRQTELIQLIKSGDLKKAGEKIKTTAISNKFPGLQKRRNLESEKFLRNI
jgi:lysozyme